MEVIRSHHSEYENLLPLEIHQRIRDQIEKIVVSLARLAVIDTDYLSWTEKNTGTETYDVHLRKYWEFSKHIEMLGANVHEKEINLSNQHRIPHPTEPETDLPLRKTTSLEQEFSGIPLPDLQKAKSHLQQQQTNRSSTSAVMKAISTNAAFDVFSKYLSINLPAGLLRQRSDISGDPRDLFTFTFEGVRPRRKLSRSDLFKEYKSRLDFRMHKHAVDFNIIYCSSPLLDDRLLFGVKTRTKKQELVSMDLQTKVCSKILSVGMIIDIITFGDLVVVAERNEPIRVFRDRLHLLSLEYRFQAQYFRNAYGNDSRIFHAYKQERLFYLTEANKIAEHMVQGCFAGRLIDIPKSSLFECICVVDNSLFALSSIGELVQYDIRGNIVTSTVRVAKNGYTYCTVVGHEKKVLVSGHTTQGQQLGAILLVYNAENLSVVQEIDFPGLKYPLHKFICFEYFNVRNWAVLHKDATSTVFLFGESNGDLKKISELKFSNVMLYDIHFHRDRLFCLGWEEQDIIQAVEFGIISVD